MVLGKLAVALRSIASALEEIEENKGKAGWEVVEEVEEQPQEPPPTCQPCGSGGLSQGHSVLHCTGWGQEAGASRPLEW